MQIKYISTVAALCAFQAVSATFGTGSDLVHIGAAAAIMPPFFPIYASWKIIGRWRRCRRMKPNQCEAEPGCKIGDKGECTTDGFLGLQKYWQGLVEYCGGFEEESCGKERMCDMSHGTCKARKLTAFRKASGWSPSKAKSERTRASPMESTDSPYDASERESNSFDQTQSQSKRSIWGNPISYMRSKYSGRSRNSRSRNTDTPAEDVPFKNVEYPTSRASNTDVTMEDQDNVDLMTGSRMQQD